MRVLGYGFCMSVHSQSTEITVSNVSDRAYNRALFRVFPLWRGLLCHLGWLFQNKIYSSGNTYPLLQQENNSIPVICKGAPGANEDFSLFSWTFCFCRNITLSPYFTSVSKLFLWTLYLLLHFWICLWFWTAGTPVLTALEVVAAFCFVVVGDGSSSNVYFFLLEVFISTLINWIQTCKISKLEWTNQQLVTPGIQGAQSIVHKVQRKITRAGGLYHKPVTPWSRVKEWCSGRTSCVCPWPSFNFCATGREFSHLSAGLCQVDVPQVLSWPGEWSSYTRLVFEWTSEPKVFESSKKLFWVLIKMTYLIL